MASKRRLRRVEENHQRKVCGRKLQFETFDSGRREVLNILRKGKSDKLGMLRPYVCSYCQKYHIGHAKPEFTHMFNAIK